MASSEQKRVTPLSLVVDFILVGGFFVFMFLILRPHVPSNSVRDVAIWAGLTSACLSSVFWLTVQMFRVVLRAQREARRPHR